LSRDREVCVCHLHDALELPQPTVSRHLAYLRRQKLVAGRKEGLWVYYRLAQPIGPLHQTLIGSVGSCLADLDELQRDRERFERLVSREGGSC
jgi:ArsR family transcriptional regulator